MDKFELLDGIINCGGDIYFTYNGKPCGLCSEVYNSIFYFQAWCGKEIKEYGSANIETVISDPFFDGKSITELLCIVDIWFG